MKNAFTYIILIIVMLGMSNMACLANSIVGTFDWNDGDTDGWSSDQSWTHLTSPGSGGVDDSGYLQIDLDATVALPPEGWYSLASAPASSLFAGTWQSEMWVEFDFWAEDVEPDYVQVRWAGEDGTVWQNTVFDSAETSMDTGTWTGLSSASFSDYANWDYGSGTQEDFVNDLSSVDWIGVYIWRNAGGAQRYGLDDFNLMVPEPSEYVMIFVASLCVVLAIRQKKGKKECVSVGV